MSRLALWLKSAIVALNLGALPIFAISPSLSAERISLSYGLLQRSIPVDSLETYARTGRIDENLFAYSQHADSKQLAQLRQALLTRIPLTGVQVSQFLYTPTGERVLNRLGEVVKTETRQPGFYAIRAALILAAADAQGFTFLNVLRKYPSRSIEIDLARSLEILSALDSLTNQTSRVVTRINDQFALQAANVPVAAALGLDPRQPGQISFAKQTLTLDDASRDRTFLADVYLPLAATPRPVIVISHGLGSDRASFAYLAEHLASYGFVVAVPEHPGSNAAQLQALLEGRSDQDTNPREFVDRPLDVKYLLDELERRSQRDADFRGRMDLQQVGVVGQSFGGYTALALAGAPIRFDQLQANCQALQDSLNVSLLLQCRALGLSPQSQYDLSDSRIKAAIAINPITSSVLGQASLSQIKIPVMLVASSADTVAPALAEQIEPFTWLTTPNKYLAVMNGGTHFSAIAESPNAVIPVPAQVVGPSPEVAQRYVDALSTAFFQTYVANQSSYRPYLSATYVNTISQASLQLSLVESLAGNTISYR